MSSKRKKQKASGSRNAITAPLPSIRSQTSKVFQVAWKLVTLLGIIGGIISPYPALISLKYTDRAAREDCLKPFLDFETEMRENFQGVMTQMSITADYLGSQSEIVKMNESVSDFQVLMSRYISLANRNQCNESVVKQLQSSLTYVEELASNIRSMGAIARIDPLGEQLATLISTKPIDNCCKQSFLGFSF